MRLELLLFELLLNFLLELLLEVDELALFARREALVVVGPIGICVC